MITLNRFIDTSLFDGHYVLSSHPIPSLIPHLRLHRLPDIILGLENIDKAENKIYSNIINWWEILGENVNS